MVFQIGHQGRITLRDFGIHRKARTHLAKRFEDTVDSDPIAVIPHSIMAQIRVRRLHRAGMFKRYARRVEREEFEGDDKGQGDLRAATPLDRLARA